MSTLSLGQVAQPAKDSELADMLHAHGRARQAERHTSRKGSKKGRGKPRGMKWGEPMHSESGWALSTGEACVAQSGGGRTRIVQTHSALEWGHKLAQALHNHFVRWLGLLRRGACQRRLHPALKPACNGPGFVQVGSSF